MIRVTLDIFSGRPNPSWVLDESAARDLIRDLAAHQDVATDADDDSGNLGLRGLIVEAEGMDPKELRGLSSRFRIGGGRSGNEGKALEFAERLVGTMGRPVGIGYDVVDTYQGLNFPSLVRGELDAAQSRLSSANGENAQASISAEPAAEDGMAQLAALNPAPVIGRDASTWSTQSAGSCSIEVATFNPTFWNDRRWIRYNNCYNYASNRRTDTFAQPGRAAGAQATVMQCSNVAAGAVADGAPQAPNCASGAPRWYMALVIWPNTDYHWYRKSAEGFWGHKPGQTAAKNTDNSGVVITNPETANRGGYTSFCGYHFSNSAHGIR